MKHTFPPLTFSCECPWGCAFVIASEDYTAMAKERRIVEGLHKIEFNIIHKQCPARCSAGTVFIEKHNCLLVSSKGEFK